MTYVIVITDNEDVLELVEGGFGGKTVDTHHKKKISFEDGVRVEKKRLVRQLKGYRADVIVVDKVISDLSMEKYVYNAVADGGVVIDLRYK